MILFFPWNQNCRSHKYIPLGGVVSSTISCGECNVVVVVVLFCCWGTPWGIKGAKLINGWGTLLTRGATDVDIRVEIFLSGGCFVCTEEVGGGVFLVFLLKVVVVLFPILEEEILGGRFVVGGLVAWWEEAGWCWWCPWWCNWGGGGGGLMPWGGATWWISWFPLIVLGILHLKEEKTILRTR